MAAPPVPPRPRQPAPAPGRPASPAPRVEAAPARTIELPATRAPEPTPPVARPRPAEPPRREEPPTKPEVEPVVTEPATKPSGARAPINPFLSKDPRQKARRLARALVSDMIVYQPEKRQQALAAGTLKEAFAEEIKKSWEEYVEQVGTDMANSTPFFTDALNEILAGGQQIF
jgi:hypothetical protein